MSDSDDHQNQNTADAESAREAGEPLPGEKREMKEANPKRKTAAKKRRTTGKTAAKKESDGGDGDGEGTAGEQRELLYSSDQEDSGSGEASRAVEEKAAGNNLEQEGKGGNGENSQETAPGGSDHSGDGEERTHSRDRNHSRQGKGQQQNQNSANHRDKGNPQQRNRGKQGKPQNPKQNQQSNRQKQKKVRRKQRKQEEEADIVLGNLLMDESLRNIEELHRLGDSIADHALEPFPINEVYDLPLNELRERVERDGVRFETAPNRRQLVNGLLHKAFEEKRLLKVSGVLDIIEEGLGGVLTYESDNYRVRPLSTYVPECLIRKYGLLPGHIVEAQVHPQREGESCPFVVRIEKVMDLDPEEIATIVPFTEGVPYYPTRRILLESSPESKFEVHWDNISMRTVDCISPVGFGQRGLIVSPPRVGKTVLLQGIANSIQNNYPEAHLIILLVDERPEEVTDFRRQIKGGEVIASTFDEPAESHVHAAEMVIEKARRMVEVGREVVILLDSITRLARAYNTTQPNSGKILSGGVEANALQKPKRFFGSARNIEDGGSLTILATALIETGSKMDEVIFEEFKGTGNMELHLDRELADKRIFPALSFAKSGTRKEELLYHPDEMQKIFSLRRAMKGVPSIEAMEMLIQRLKKTQSNAEFLMTLSR